MHVCTSTITSFACFWVLRFLKFGHCPREVSLNWNRSKSQQFAICIGSIWSGVLGIGGVWWLLNEFWTSCGESKVVERFDLFARSFYKLQHYGCENQKGFCYSSGWRKESRISSKSSSRKEDWIPTHSFTR